MNDKTFWAIVLLVVWGMAAHRLFGADWFDLNYNLSAQDAQGGQYGLYCSNNASISYGQAFSQSPSTNLVFDASKLPNPCYIALRYQLGTNQSDFSEWVYFNTNDYAINLTAPSGLKIKRHRGL